MSLLSHAEAAGIGSHHDVLMVSWLLERIEHVEDVCFFQGSGPQELHASCGQEPLNCFCL